MPDPDPERALLLRGLLAAMRFSRESMLLTDPHQQDNPIVAANEGFERLTGYQQAELVGRNCRLLQGPATEVESVRQLGEAIRRGQGFVQILANYRKSGALFWNLLFISPVMGHDGQLHFFFASQYDLSAGPPLNMAELPLGPAHMSPGQQTEFRLLLLDIAHEVAAADRAPGLAMRVRALEATIAAAREIAVLSTSLSPGTKA
ncbi:MAG: PAS domain-containing protein [Acetobacteraceae bacterium]|nr:PAS domain-containing protein [Acetobacteraceae bacterium]